MRARSHRFLLLFLMLALPLQAFASATLFGYMAGHTAAMESVAMADNVMADCHEPGPEHLPASLDCKHCAACVLGAALPIPSLGGVPLLPQSAGFATPPAAAFSGFVPDGPERPPRPALA